MDRKGFYNVKRIYRQNEIKELIKWVDNKAWGVVGMTSLYAHPTLHLGHLNLLEDCKNHCDFLIVVINGKKSTIHKYQKEIVNIESRLKLVASIRFVDVVIEYDAIFMDQALRDISPNKFLKGGDRRKDDGSIHKCEIDACKDIDCEIIDGVGGFEKYDSNSRIIEDIKKSKISELNSTCFDLG